MLGSPPRFIFVIRTQIHTHITHTHNFFIPSTTERRRLPHISFLLLLTSQSKATTPNSTPPHNFCTLQTLLYTPHQISLLSLSLSLSFSLSRCPPLEVRIHHPFSLCRSGRGSRRHTHSAQLRFARRRRRRHRDRERRRRRRSVCTMSSFAEAPEGNVAKGAKIFKTKCAQCHVAEKGGGHKQVCAWRERERERRHGMVHGARVLLTNAWRRKK